MPEEILHKNIGENQEEGGAVSPGETKAGAPVQDAGERTPGEAGAEEAWQEKNEELAAKLLARENEIEELTARLQRLQADFENFRRRSRKELEEMARFGAERLVAGLLPVLDNFSRALATSPRESGDASLLAGMEMIYRQMREALAKEGVEPVRALGEPFDPSKHEAVLRVETESPEEDNTVVEELQKGYTFHERLIRPSMVKVAKYSGEKK